MNYYFWGLLAVCTIYALALGGAPERIGAGLYALAVVATNEILWADVGRRWMHLDIQLFLVDFVLFVAFCVLTLLANRFWPIWVSALLGLGVLGHLARWAGPDLFWYAYALALTIWSYPILVLIAWGTFNHRRRLRRFGSDPSWSNSSGRSARPSASTR
jgi:hypothetical protein